MKKYLSLLSAGILSACVCSAGAYLPADAAADTAATISVSEIWAKPGETVTVEIAVQHNSGFAALSLNIDYDTKKLTLLDAQNQADWKSAEFISGGDKTAVPYTLNWDSDGTADFTADCVLARLQFAVNADAADDAVIGVTVNQSSTFRADFNDAVLGTKNGIIHIGVSPETELLRGDVDGSGTVDVTDAQMTLSAYAESMAGNKSLLQACGYACAGCVCTGFALRHSDHPLGHVKL